MDTSGMAEMVTKCPQLLDCFFQLTHAALRELHKGMWDGVDARIHMPLKVFPFGTVKEGGSYEVMISGTVEHVKTDGSSVTKDMAVRARYDSEGGDKWVIGYLQVWLTP
jgi:hypothetical protein